MNIYHFVEGLTLSAMGMLVFNALVRDAHHHDANFRDYLGATISAGMLSCGVTALILSFL